MKKKTGILLVNLGTPDSPETPDVRKYLREFLMDERVIDIPYVRRSLLVNGIIAPFRAPKSGATYKEIWTKEGSPLLLYGIELRDKLRDELGEEYQVELAMRYQSPSIADTLEKFRGKPLHKLRVIPLFPQYASASSGSVMQKVMEELSSWLSIPSVEIVSSFHDHPGMIETFAQLGRELNPGEYDHILFSFHGVPERQLTKSDPGSYCAPSGKCCHSLNEKNHFCYGAQSYDTAYKIAEALGLPREKYTICFQSRLGKTPWIQPYTSNVLKDMAAAGHKKLLVFAPAFVADCLETIYEVSTEYDEEFKELGGEKVQLVPSLNAHPLWVKALADLARE